MKKTIIAVIGVLASVCLIIGIFAGCKGNWKRNRERLRSGRRIRLRAGEQIWFHRQ